MHKLKKGEFYGTQYQKSDEFKSRFHRKLNDSWFSKLIFKILIKRH